jgi:hypothetical protein
MLINFSYLNDEEELGEECQANVRVTSPEKIQRLKVALLSKFDFISLMLKHCFFLGSFLNFVYVIENVGSPASRRQVEREQLT